MHVEAEESVTSAFQGTVSNNTLRVGTVAPITTTKPIELVVTLPFDQLVSVTSRVPNLVMVAPGFEGDSVTLTNCGLGVVAMINATVDAIAINNHMYAWFAIW